MTSPAETLANLRLRVGDALLDLLRLARQLNEAARAMIPRTLDESSELGWEAGHVLDAIRISQKITEFEVNALPKMSALEELSSLVNYDSSEGEISQDSRVSPDVEPTRKLNLVGLVTGEAATIEEEFEEELGAEDWDEI